MASLDPFLQYFLPCCDVVGCKLAARRLGLSAFVDTFGLRDLTTVDAVWALGSADGGGVVLPVARQVYPRRSSDSLCSCAHRTRVVPGDESGWHRANRDRACWSTAPAIRPLLVRENARHRGWRMNPVASSTTPAQAHRGRRRPVQGDDQLEQSCWYTVMNAAEQPAITGTWKCGSRAVPCSSDPWPLLWKSPSPAHHRARHTQTLSDERGGRRRGIID